MTKEEKEILLEFQKLTPQQKKSALKKMALKARRRITPLPEKIQQ